MQNIPGIVKEHAGRYASREVFRFKDSESGKYNSISWKDLVNDMDLVAQALLSQGYRYKSNIGVFSQNRPEWTITDLGILSTRSVVVPFYATASTTQLKYIVDETEMELMFVGGQEQMEKALWLLDNCESLIKIISYDPANSPNDSRIIQWEDFKEFGNSNEYKRQLDDISNEAKADDLATIIYTSGTTGEPKGVMLGHDNFIQAFKINYTRLDVSKNDVSLCFLPLSHVFERTWTLFLLYCGATNVFLENPREVIDEMPKVKPTLMCTVPRFYEKTYEGIQSEAAKWSLTKKKIFDWSIDIGHRCIEYRKDARRIPIGLSFKHALADKLVLKKLRLIFGGNIKFMPCAGAAIRPDLLRFFHATGLFVNYGYGATETTATVSCFRTDKYSFDYCGSIMPEVEIRIGDKDEILIKGETVFKGYYKKSNETQKVLVNGWYKSGDEGYVTDDGYLMMTDRINDLIKTSGGKYVSPQKVEALIGSDKYIEQIVVIGDNRKFVSAIIVPSFENLNELAELLKIKSLENKELIFNKEIQDFLAKRIEDGQKELTPYEKVVKYILLPEAFSVDNHALTNTLKIRRKVIMERYKEQIEEMYR